MAVTAAATMAAGATDGRAGSNATVHRSCRQPRCMPGHPVSEGFDLREA